MRSGNVASVTSTGNTIVGTFRHEVTYPAGVKDAPTGAVVRDSTARVRQRQSPPGAASHAEPRDCESAEHGYPAVGRTSALVRSRVAPRGRARIVEEEWPIPGHGRSWGGSRARQYDPSSAKRTTFADVAGIEEVENEVKEIVDFLRNPARYRQMGAQIPRGVLLSGAPGTGKTLLARAVAGEAQVPFFSISASEFVEMIVGVGASRVRDLFDKAKQVAPSIIFIDELDAIGRARGGTASVGGYDEREQTLNQILTEMDGFTGNEGVVVLAATNRPEVLDPALLRPGRFDRRVTVSAPDQRGRAQILRVHTRGVPLDADVDLDALAASTPGMVGADLQNLVNEAALLAVRRGHERVAMADLTDSLEKLVLGTVRGIVLSREERERTAYHESGHALLGMLTAGADPVRKISIIPRGQALGVTFQAPETRPVRLFRRIPARPDHRCVGWARSGRGRLRRCHHRCRERSRACQQHRPANGGALGNVTSHRARFGAALARPGVAFRLRRRRPRHQGPRRGRGTSDHRGVLRASSHNPAIKSGSARSPGTDVVGPRNAGRGRGLCRRWHDPRDRSCRRSAPRKRHESPVFDLLRRAGRLDGSSEGHR